MDKKYYQLGTYTEAQWDELNAELISSGNTNQYVPKREVECVDDQLHSPTRGTYLLSNEEAEDLKNDSRIKFINVDYKRYPEFKPPPKELQSTPPEQIQRYQAQILVLREFEISGGLGIGNEEANRTGYQLLRPSAYSDLWIDNSFPENTPVFYANLLQNGTGKHIDLIVADEGMWIGHPEFQSNSVLISNGTPIEKPGGYRGGNLLPGNGTCDVLDLILDGPYYIDPDWFNSNPGSRLTTRWDGTIVPVESVARSWWSNSSQRSVKFSGAGTVFVPSYYTRLNTSGSNAVRPAGGDGEHGTPCGALAFGRSQGWAYNAKKWTLDLYGFYGVGIEEGFDIQKIFHQLKPINPLFGTKDPTISSNSWGYRSNKDPAGATRYYNHRSTINVPYNTESGIAWLSHMGTQGDGGRWKSEMKTNSLTAALDELVASGVIFVAASGNSNQKQVESSHPDFNNFITATNGGSLTNSNFFEFGVAVTGTTNRRGFPQQGGMFNDDSGNRVYPVINIGALDDQFKLGLEAKVNYSDRGNSIDVYAPADGTLTANSTYSNLGQRVDTYPGFSFNGGVAYDTSFGGTSAACPVAAGFIATLVELNRDWTWRDVRSHLQSLTLQSGTSFYEGTESTTVNDSNWFDYESLEGGDARVLYQGKIEARFKPGSRPVFRGSIKVPPNIRFKK